MGALDTVSSIINIDLNFDWAEFFALIFIMFGFVAGLFSSSPRTMVLVIFLVGLMFGRAWYAWKKRGKVPIFLIMMGFIFGTLLWFFYVDPRVLVVAFCIGAWAGYMVFKKKLLKAVR